MALNADDLQEMITHWLFTPAGSILGTDYGSNVTDLLHTPLSSGQADALIAKLRTDIQILGDLPPDAVNLYAQTEGPDQMRLYFEVAGQFIQIDQLPALGAANDDLGPNNSAINFATR